jgi:hypothetical protein
LCFWNYASFCRRIVRDIINPIMFIVSKLQILKLGTPASSVLIEVLYSLKPSVLEPLFNFLHFRLASQHSRED